MLGRGIPTLIHFIPMWERAIKWNHFRIIQPVWVHSLPMVPFHAARPHSGCGFHPNILIMVSGFSFMVREQWYSRLGTMVGVGKGDWGQWWWLRGVMAMAIQPPRQPPPPPPPQKNSTWLPVPYVHQIRLVHLPLSIVSLAMVKCMSLVRRLLIIGLVLNGNILGLGYRWRTRKVLDVQLIG